MFENIRELSKYITGNSKNLEFTIPYIEIKRNDNSQVRDKIMSIDPEKILSHISMSSFLYIIIF